jgi:uncharacterized membrane protein
MLHIRRHILLRLVLGASACLLATALPALADFTVCNKTRHTAVVAIGFKAGDEWASEGWWRVKPQACRNILKGKLKTRYYFLHAAQEGVDGDWDGMRTFCVKAKNFSIRGRKDCRQRKLGKARFFTVDTEKELTWVQNLSD